MKMLIPNLATCQLAVCAEDVIKFELKLSSQHGRETKQKRCRNGVGDKGKMTYNVGSVNKN